MDYRIPKAVYFDMDGTLANLYGVANWLQYLQNEDVRPYAVAAPMVDMMMLDDLIRLLQDEGVHVGVISWGSKNSSWDYLKRTAQIKIDWVHNFLPTIEEIQVLKYGIDKSQHADISRDAVLVDDDFRVRTMWDSPSDGRSSVDATDVIGFMAQLARLVVSAKG